MEYKIFFILFGGLFIAITGGIIFKLSYIFNHDTVRNGIEKTAI